MSTGIGKESTGKVKSCTGNGRPQCIGKGKVSTGKGMVSTSTGKECTGKAW